MRIDRRAVIKGVALGGLAGLTVGRSIASFAEHPSAAACPLLVLVNGDAAGTVFVRGAAASGGAHLQMYQITRDLGFLMDFERRLRGSPALRAVGLLDNAAATLVVDVARGAGARVQWLGQHTAEGAQTRHHLLATGRAASCAARLRERLDMDGAGFQVIEERVGGPAARNAWSASSRSRAPSAVWASTLGYLLASLDARPARAAPVPLGGAVLRGSFMSFSIEA